MSGGQNLWASPDRTAIIQIVNPGQGGLQEKRYQMKLTEDQWAEMERLAGLHHLATLTMPKRDAVPDEAHPVILLSPKQGKPIKLMKLADDKNAEFDPVYEYLQRLCKPQGQLIKDGPFDWNWWPEGFHQPW